MKPMLRSKKPSSIHTVYLKRANSKLICHCHCRDALISFPLQAACPWCGCGWLFTCSKCGKAFTFAKAVEIDFSLEDLVKRGFDAMQTSFTRADIRSWVSTMRRLLKGVVPGEQYVYFDGQFVPTAQADLELTGLHMKHSLNCVPQVEALRDKSIIKGLLRNQSYWESSRRAPTRRRPR